MNQRRILANRGLDIHDRRQPLVLDSDQVARVFGHVPVFSHDKRHGLTRVVDVLARQRILRLGMRQGIVGHHHGRRTQHVAQIFRRPNGMDPGKLARFGGVN